MQAANTLIYPMFWQHIFIPVLPQHLMEYLTAPMPFLIGVPQPLFARTNASELGDVVVLDIDAKTFESPFNDVDNIPPEIIHNLRKSLSDKNVLGDTVSRAFLQALVHLIGGYREALKYRQGEKVSFSDDEFIKSRSSSVQPFLVEMLQLQIFRQFIEERLELLNAGKGFSDPFELECVSFSEDKYSRKAKHVVAINNVKREGAAIAKAVKDKANPAMKHAVKTVKDGGKMARIKVKASYKDAKSKFKDDKEEIPDENINTHSAPSSPTMRRASNISSPNTSFLTRNNTDLNFGRVLKYEKFDPPDRRDLSPEFEEIPKLDFGDIMHSMEEVMNRNKSEPYSRLQGNSSSASSPVKKHSVPNKVNHNTEDTSAVGDLITLSDVDTVVFDPLLDNQRFTQNPHRKLERTAAPIQNGELRKYSQGKYENFVPAGGSSQREFKEFLTTMTDPANNINHSNHARTSEDVKLNEYGINFQAMSIARQVPGYGAAAGQPPPPPVPPRASNSSFLHGGGGAGSPYIPGHNTLNSSMPVNSRISSVGQYQQQPQQQQQHQTDVFADLDLLGSVRGSHAPPPSSSLPGGLEAVSSPLPPPVVPPRSKQKQWTTFDE